MARPFKFKRYATPARPSGLAIWLGDTRIELLPWEELKPKLVDGLLHLDALIHRRLVTGARFVWKWRKEILVAAAIAAALYATYVVVMAVFAFVMRYWIPILIVFVLYLVNANAPVERAVFLRGDLSDFSSGLRDTFRGNPIAREASDFPNSEHVRGPRLEREETMRTTESDYWARKSREAPIDELFNN